jgi:hypothetical protein
MLSQLPPPNDEMLAAGLKSHWFLSVGNHEVWVGPNIAGTLSAVAYLQDLGVTPERLIYKFDFNGVRFIFLWSGKYDYRSLSGWDADPPKYAEQMQQWLDEAKAKGIRKALVHTTEFYNVDGVKYLLLGGGGAEQDPVLPGRSHVKVLDFPLFRRRLHSFGNRVNEHETDDVF